MGAVQVLTKLLSQTRECGCPFLCKFLQPPSCMADVVLSECGKQAAYQPASRDMWTQRAIATIRCCSMLSLCKPVCYSRHGKGNVVAPARCGARDYIHGVNGMVFVGN